MFIVLTTFNDREAEAVGPFVSKSIAEAFIEDNPSLTPNIIGRTIVPLGVPDLYGMPTKMWMQQFV